MRKRLACLLLSLLVAGSSSGCASFSAREKVSETFLDVFDTVTEVTVYTDDPAAAREETGAKRSRRRRSTSMARRWFKGKSGSGMKTRSR